jgi:hypothetical protein
MKICQTHVLKVCLARAFLASRFIHKVIVAGALVSREALTATSFDTAGPVIAWFEDLEAYDHLEIVSAILDMFVPLWVCSAIILSREVSKASPGLYVSFSADLGIQQLQNLQPGRSYRSSISGDRPPGDMILLYFDMVFLSLLRNRWKDKIWRDVLRAPE